MPSWADSLLDVFDMDFYFSTRESICSIAEM
jgi:hypothetical protein